MAPGPQGSRDCKEQGVPFGAPFFFVWRGHDHQWACVAGRTILTATTSGSGAAW